MTKYSITVYTIENEKLYSKDHEADHYDQWSGSFEITVEADSIDEALKKAAAQVDVPNWRRIEFTEQTGPRSFMDHSINNDQYLDELYQKYQK